MRLNKTRKSFLPHETGRYAFVEWKRPLSQMGTLNTIVFVGVEYDPSNETITNIQIEIVEFPILS